MSTQSKHLSSVLIEKNIEGFTLTYHQRLIYATAPKPLSVDWRGRCRH